MQTSPTSKNVTLAGDIVAAFVSNNHVQPTELAAIITSVHQTLTTLSQGGATAEPEVLTPAVAVKKSVTPDHIICLEDGKPFKSLRRHLQSKYNLTPEAYRAKWGLPVDYPMVAPNYAKARSELARAIGLGARGRGDTSASTAAPAPAAPAPSKTASKSAKAETKADAPKTTDKKAADKKAAAKPETKAAAKPETKAAAAKTTAKKPSKAKVKGAETQAAA